MDEHRDKQDAAAGEGGPPGSGASAEEMGGATGITGGGESARPGEGVQSSGQSSGGDASGTTGGGTSSGGTGGAGRSSGGSPSGGEDS